MVGRSPHRGLLHEVSQLREVSLLHEVSQGSEHCSRLLHRYVLPRSGYRYVHRYVLARFYVHRYVHREGGPLHREVFLLLSQREPLHWGEPDFHGVRVNPNQMDMELGHLGFLECHH